MWVSVHHETSFMPYGDNKANNPVITKGNPTENVEIVITPGILDTQ